MRNLIRVDPYHGGIQFTYSDGFRLSIKIGPSSLPNSNSEEWMEVSILNGQDLPHWLTDGAVQIHIEMLPTLLRAMEQENAQEIILNMTRNA